jgi:hypothetical protein
MTNGMTVRSSGLDICEAQRGDGSNWSRLLQTTLFSSPLRPPQASCEASALACG